MLKQAVLQHLQDASESRFILEYYLAPLAEITSVEFRELCYECGADICYSEMISAKAVSLGNRKTLALSRIGNEKKTFLQLFGNDPEVFREAAQIILEKESPYGVDINAGCPVRKVVGTGSGSMLMEDPEKLGKIVKAVRSVTDLPLSVKIRKGFMTLSYLECAHQIQDNGADLLIVHPRLRSEMFSGISDFNVSVELADKLNIPVVHSGDIKTMEDVEFFKDSAVSGLMIGRGALGAPWIFSELKGRELSVEEKKFYIQKHLLYYLSTDLDPKHGHLMMKKHASWYSSGMKGSSDFRRQMFKPKQVLNETIDHVNKFFGIDL